MKVPSVGEHIEIYPFEENKVNIFNRSTKKTFLIGEKEATVLSLMDGKHTSEEISEECGFYSVQEIEKLIAAFDDIGVFKAEKTKLNILKIKKRIFNPNKLIKDGSTVSKILSYMIFIGCPLLFVAGILINVFSGTTVTDDIINAYGSFRIWDVVILLVLSCLSLSLHEVGHMVSARRYGVNVPEIGIMLYYFVPCAYTNISGLNLLKSKKQRIMILASGTFVNLGIIGLLYILMNLISSPLCAAYCLVLIIINFGTIFMNGMMFLKFDGYYIAEILFDEYQLKEKASLGFKQYIMAMFNKDKNVKVAYRNEINADSEKKLAHVAYCVFSIISMAYIPIMIINSVLSVFAY